MAQERSRRPTTPQQKEPSPKRVVEQRGPSPVCRAGVDQSSLWGCPVFLLRLGLMTDKADRCPWRHTHKGDQEGKDHGCGGAHRYGAHIGSHEAPPQKAMGRMAAITVRVARMVGFPTSSTASIATVNLGRSRFSSRWKWRTTFSTSHNGIIHENADGKDQRKKGVIRLRVYP